MPLNLNNARKCLADFDFPKLFIEEVGWDRHVQRIDLTLDGQSFTLSAVAHKRGMVAFLHEGKPPDYPTRRAIERQVARNVHEHLLIFTDPQRTTQIWQWVKREPGKPLACREHTYRRDQPGDSLIQKLQALAFSIEDEDNLTIVDVTGRVRAGFDVERVTKRFYDKFKDEHAAFLDFNEINPDVLGYIFEKYINQKQMGAYYTKEDITEYISKNTIIPRLFDMAKAKCKVAFEQSGAGISPVWNLLKENPDRYIYDAVKHGLELPLPPEIEKGVDTTKPDLLERRKEWNKPAPPEYALPTEIWREVVARRQRYAEIRARLTGDLASPEAEIGEKSASASPQSPSPTTRGRGGICDINDLITYNLDIRQFAQDVIENSEPDLLSVFYGAIREVTALDPTCGSGAFLFAALSSDVFWWWYTVTSNVRDLNPFDIQNFPLPESALADPTLQALGTRYLKDLDKNSAMLVREQKQTGTTETQSFKIQKSKSIIDEIDRALAKHYGFTDPASRGYAEASDELDFIINYDIKYRMGLGGEESGE